MYILKIEPFLIELAESIVRHLPVSIVSRVKPFLERWREKLNFEIMQEIKLIVTELHVLRKEILKMISLTSKLRNRPPTGGRS